MRSGMEITYFRDHVLVLFTLICLTYAIMYGNYIFLGKKINVHSMLCMSPLASTTKKNCYVVGRIIEVRIKYNLSIFLCLLVL